MSAKPIFVATHPRACSTAFERVFMTRRDTLKCIHEPFGDAFYYGPERLSPRFENDEKARLSSGFSDSSYQIVFDRINREALEGKRIFIKDIIHYLFPPDAGAASLAPSLQVKKRGIGTNGHDTGITNGTTSTTNPSPSNPPYPYNTPPEPDNPTVIPKSLLSTFHFTFLIRDPHASISSYFRCTIPPLDDLTGFHSFLPAEAGYDELRRFFTYVTSTGIVGPHHANGWNSHANRPRSPVEGVEICVVDADDMLDNPAAVIEAYCKSVGIEYEPDMLNWDNESDQRYAEVAFEKWKGFHEDAIESTELKPRGHDRKTKSEADWDREWAEKYGPKAAKLIRETVDKNMDDYLFLKQFALKATMPN